MSGGILSYGDHYGEWRPLLRACRDERPDAVVLLGDCDLDRPLSQNGLFSLNWTYTPPTKLVI